MRDAVLCSAGPGVTAVLIVRPSVRPAASAAALTVYASILSSCLLFFLTVDSETGLIMLEILLSSAPRHHGFISLYPPPHPSPAPSSLLFLF